MQIMTFLRCEVMSRDFWKISEWISCEHWAIFDYYWEQLQLNHFLNKEPFFGTFATIKNPVFLKD
jgi:hypothetical protein